MSPRSVRLVASCLACAGLVFASPRAMAQPAACRTTCAEGEVFDDAAACCVTAPDLGEAERAARAAEAAAVATARAELDAAGARERAAFEGQDAGYRTLVLAPTVSFLTNYVRMDHPSFLGDVARSGVFRLAGLLDVTAPLLRREPDRRPLLSVEASVAAEAPVSYVGSFMFLPGLRGELRLRALYVAPFVYSEVQWFTVRLDAITVDGAGPRERGRASSAGFGTSFGSHGKVDGFGCLVSLRWGPLIDGGDAHVSGELRIMDGKQLWEVYFRGFDRLGEFTHSFWIGLAYGATL